MSDSREPRTPPPEGSGSDGRSPEGSTAPEGSADRAFTDGGSPPGPAGGVSPGWSPYAAPEASAPPGFSHPAGAQAPGAQAPGVRAQRGAQFDAVIAGAAYGVLTVLGIVLGVVGSFHSSWIVSDVPIVAIIATVVNLVVFWGGGWAMKSKLGSLLPAVTWLIVVLLLSMQRSEGDLIVAGSAAGELFLVGGSVAAAVAVGLAPAARLEAMLAQRPGPAGSSGPPDSPGTEAPRR